MGHPDRNVLRERKKRARQENLKRRNDLDVLDLTPYNAVRVIKKPQDTINCLLLLMCEKLSGRAYL